MYAFLLIEVVDHRRILAGESLEALFATGIRQAAAIEHESAAVAALVFRPAPVKGKAENPHDQIVRFGSQALQFLRSQHAVERLHQCRQPDGQLDVVQQPAQVFQRVGNALQEMSFALIKAAETIGPQRLQNAGIDVGIVVLHEHFVAKFNEAGKRVQIVIEQLLTQLWRQVGLGVVQERSDVILQGAFAAALIVQEKWQAVAQHNVARLEVAIQKVIVGGAQQELGQAAEVVLQRLFVEGDASQSEKIVFEIIQIPGDGLAIETGARIAHFVVQIPAGFHLKPRQNGDHFAIRIDHLRSNALAGAMFREELIKCRVAQVFLEIGALGQIVRINLRHRQTVPVKVPGEFEKRDVLFPHTIQNANRAVFFAGQPDDLAPPSTEFALQRQHPFDGRVEVLLKKLFEDVHECVWSDLILTNF